MQLTPGQRLGAYEVVGPLGAGGLGEVYRARHTALDRLVAIKVLPAPLAVDPDAGARFEREARAVAALSHPNILAIHDFAIDGTTAYVVMELLEGGTLRERLVDGGLPLKKAAQIARDVALVSRPLTTPASSIATSSQRTSSCSRATRWSPTSASRTRSARRARTG